MVDLIKSANEIWRDFVTDGVPASGAHKPIKADIRAWSSAVEVSTSVAVESFEDGDGDLAALQRGIDYVNSLGGGELRFDARQYDLSGVPVIKTGVRFVGKGSNNTILKLAVGANTAVLKTVNFDTLVGGGTTGGPSDFAVVGMTLDGRRGSQAGVPDGLDIYGFRYLIEDVVVQNVQGHGFRSEWGPFGEFPMEATIRRLKIDTSDRHGFWFKGPHDSYGEDIIIVDAGQAADDTWDGFLVEGNGNGRWINVHSWHRSTVTNRMLSSARVESGGNDFIAPHFEGGRQCLIQRGDRNTYKGTHIYAGFSTDPMAMIRGSHVFFDARIEDTVPSGAACLQIGEGGDALFFAHLDVMAITAATNAVVVTNSSGRNTGIIKTVGATNAFTGSFHGSDRITIQRPDATVEGYVDSLGVGINSGIANPLHVRGSVSPVLAERYSADNAPAALILRKSRSATLGTNTILQSGDSIAGIRFRAADGTGFIEGAVIDAVVDGTPGANDMPGRLDFSTTPDGSATPSLALRLDSSQNTLAKGSIKSDHATRGIGYATGAGGAVTQITSKATGVTLNTVTGQITMNNAALGAGATVSFTVTNSAHVATDLVTAHHSTGGTAGAYRVNVKGSGAAGSFILEVTNTTGGSLSEAPVINFALIKGVNA